MLVCPQCQFENPDNNKFCQKCGTSLTEKACPACAASVPFDVEYCPECGTATATLWRAVLTRANAVDAQSAAIASSESIATKYLDAQQRYQLLEPIPELVDATVGVEVRVLDSQPFQPSPLEMLYDEQFAEGDREEEAALAAEKFAIPAIAQAYLQLQQELYPSLPQIHDAWEQNGQTIVLLEDRSFLTALEDLWNDETVPPFQILHLLHQMTEIWAVLQPQGYAQSLLELSNLKVDEDQLLYLQRLYTEIPNQPPQLSDLGQIWVKLFQQPSPRPEFSSLLVLCQELEAGQIASFEQLRSHLNHMAAELQPASPIVVEPAAPAPASPEGPDTVPLPPAAAVDCDELDPDQPITPPIDLCDIDEEVPGEGDDIPTVVLPMKLISIEDAGRSDIGRQRDHNEDYFSIQTEVKKLESLSGRSLQVKGLYILCDGMGGHAGGEVASALAVDTLRQYFQENWKDQLPSESVIRQGILLANKAIFDLNQQNDSSGAGRMGTTVVVLLVQDTLAAIAHVGDSRLYRFSRRRGLEQVTVDHEVGQREIQRGVEQAIAYARPDAYQLTQALGPRDENYVNPDVQFLELNEDLLLLLCSDGLTDNHLLEIHTPTHIEPLLNFQNSLEHGVNQLIDLANQFNGHDNITAVAVRTRVRPNLEALRRPSS